MARKGNGVEGVGGRRNRQRTTPSHGTEVTDLIIDAGKTRLIASDQTVGSEQRCGSDGGYSKASTIGCEEIREQPMLAAVDGGGGGRSGCDDPAWRGARPGAGPGAGNSVRGSSVRRPVSRQGNGRCAERRRRAKEFRRRAPTRGSAARRLGSQNDGGPVEPGEGQRRTQQDRPSQATR